MTAPVSPVLIAAIAIIAGCSAKVEPVKATIYQVIENPSKWGCIGTNWETYVRTEDGRVDMICGRWGAVGDTITGRWVSGSFDSTGDGFKL